VADPRCELGDDSQGCQDEAEWNVERPHARGVPSFTIACDRHLTAALLGDDYYVVYPLGPQDGPGG